MNTLFALQGKGSLGKSSTIKKLYELLKQEYPNAEVENYNLRSVDIKFVLLIDGVKIGIESQGDPRSRLEKSLTEFVELGCNIIVCATRTSGMTVNWVNQYHSQYDIQFIQQKEAEESEQDNSNLSMAEFILAKIKLLIQS